MFGKIMNIDLQEREVAALERIAKALERMAGPEITVQHRPAVLTQVTEEELWEQEQREQELIEQGQLSK